MIMKKYITKTLILFKLSLLSLTFVGCGKGSKPTSEKKKKTAVVSGTSISYSNNYNEPLNASKIQELNLKLSQLVTNQLENINNKEATLFSKVTQYCDQEGHKEIENHGEISTHTKEIEFEQCQEANTLQNGSITVAYEEANEDGKFPKTLEITSTARYSFNHTELSNNTTIRVENIHYNEALKADALKLTISGEVHLENGVYKMQNFMQRAIL